MIPIQRTSRELTYWENAFGHFHRTDGPAIMHNCGDVSWYVDGQLFITNKSYQYAAKLSDEEMVVIILKYGKIK